MKKKIKWLAMLIAGFVLGANAAEITGGGVYYWIVTGGGEITINAEDVASNGYFADNRLVVGHYSSDNHLIIDAANVLVNGGSGGITIGSGSTNNTLELINSTTVSAGGISIGDLGDISATGNRLILGEGSTITISVDLSLLDGNTLEFAGGTVSVDFFRIKTGSEIVVSGNYDIGKTILSWNTISSGASYLDTADKVLDAFNAAGSGYEFALGADGKSIQVIPEPASVLMVVAVAGVVGFYRRFFCKI